MKKSKNRENLYLFDREYNNSEIFSVDDHVDINRCHELYENPFLYNRNNANIIADSIEDFAVTYKDCNIYFGSFVRSSLIPLKEKKKYNRIFFQKWKSDFHLKYNDLVNKQCLIIKTIENIKVDKLRKKKVAFVLISLIILIVFTFISLVSKKIINLVNVNDYFSNVFSCLSELYKNNIFKMFVVVYYLVIIIPIVLLFITKKKSISIKRDKKAANKEINNGLKNMRRLFYKRYPLTFKYYKKKIKKEKGYFTPLDIKKVSCACFDFKRSEEMLDRVKINAIKTETSLRRIRKTLDVLVYVSILFSIICIGVIIYLLLRNL